MTQENLKELEIIYYNTIYIYIIQSVFLDITKSADFRWKNADVSRSRDVYQVIHKFFGSSLGKV